MFFIVRFFLLEDLIGEEDFGGGGFLLEELDLEENNLGENGMVIGVRKGVLEEEEEG